MGEQLLTSSGRYVPRDRQYVTTTRVDLPHCGYIVATFSGDPFMLSAEDREFVFDLADTMRALAALASSSRPASEERDRG